jgi:membrane protease YdiL (CAAX protease family)
MTCHCLIFAKTTFVMKQNSTSNSIYSIWKRLPLIVWAVFSGLFISGVGVFIWGGLLSRFNSVWVILPMIAILWMYWKVFSGSWGSNRLAENRKTWFRSTDLSASTWKWGISAAIFFVLIVQSSFVVTFRFIDFPAAKFTADYKALDSFPLWAAWAIIIMSSIVAGICEEVGFRGYMQAPLEKKYGPATAIIITSVLFTLIHLSHTWAAPILPHIFFASILLGMLAWRSGSLIPGIIGHSILDIFDYSVWWTDLTGGFKHQTIFKTGLDLHFIIWGFIFLFAVFAFYRIIQNLNSGRCQKII